jgi:chemotaxis protein histidine kinase CheA
VDVGLLDKLMNLVGELVLARNQILQYSNATEDTGIVAPSQRLNLITTEQHQGDYRKVVEGVNNTLDAVIGPLNVAADYVDKISKGNITSQDHRQLQRRFQHHQEQPEPMH